MDKRQKPYAPTYSFKILVGLLSLPSGWSPDVLHVSSQKNILYPETEQEEWCNQISQDNLYTLFSRLPMIAYAS
jgi:hypothetical protein